MQQIFSSKNVTRLSRLLHQDPKRVVLVGGCFDVLHPGHVIFLEKAKAAGDILVVLLESDQTIKRLKGMNRPVHTQADRAKILSALRPVDFVLNLPEMKTDQDYEKLILKLRPAIIAATLGDPDIAHKERIAKLVGAKLRFVTKMIGSYSTTKILNHKLITQMNY